MKKIFFVITFAPNGANIYDETGLLIKSIWFKTDKPWKELCYETHEWPVMFVDSEQAMFEAIENKISERFAEIGGEIRQSKLN